MEVDQKHITTIRLHDAKGGDIAVCREGHDYVLRLSSPNTMVNIALGLADLRKLCQELVRVDVEESWRAQTVTPPADSRSVLFNGVPRYYQDAVSSWLSRMATSEAAEKACCKR